MAEESHGPIFSRKCKTVFNTNTVKTDLDQTGSPLDELSVASILAGFRYRTNPQPHRIYYSYNHY